MPPDFGPSLPLSPALFPSAVYAIPDLDALDAIYAGQSPGFIYARDGHPNAATLATKLNHLHGATWGTVCGSGMGAIAAAVLPLVKADDRIVASDKLYGKTTKLFRELAKFGVATAFVDSNDLGAVEAALSGGAAVLFVETISNPLCRVCDLPELAALAKRAGATLIVDNTFASPVLCRPLELGADLVMESLTKIINGHSDVTLGYLGGRDTGLSPTITAAASTYGFFASPFDCWLTERSLDTVDLRTRTAAANAQQVADWLADQPAVRRVVFPGRPDHPDHDLAKRLLPAGFGHMLCFELAERNAVNRFLRAANAVPFAPSLGHAHTTCSYPDGTSHRFEAVEEKRKQGITLGLVRLSVGCEAAEVIRRNLAAGLTAVPTAVPGV
jgi:cystathionine beta-lyase/cystathionine gamma-synthase